VTAETGITLAASAAERWRRLGEETRLPEDHREILLGLLAGDGGTTTGAVAGAAGVSNWTARAWMEKLRNEGAVTLSGAGRAARWELAAPGTGGSSPSAKPPQQQPYTCRSRKGHHMTVTVTPGERDELVRWAAYISARPADSVSVTAAAAPWLEWMGQAAGEPDKRARRKALYRQHHNVSLQHYRNGGPLPSPGEFLAEAKGLYEFTRPFAVSEEGQKP
jgi:hypothetical protein